MRLRRKRSALKDDQSKNEKEQAVAGEPCDIEERCRSRCDERPRDAVHLVHGRQQLDRLALPVAIISKERPEDARAYPDGCQSYPVVFAGRGNEEADAAERDINQASVQHEIPDVESAGDHEENSGKEQHSTEETDEVHNEQLRVVENRAHRLREHEAVIPHLSVSRDDSVERDQYRDRDEGSRQQRHDTRYELGSHLGRERAAERQQLQVSPQQADYHDGDTLLHHEVAELPEGIFGQSPAIHCVSPTASRNCCSSTDRSGITLVTSAPRPMRSASDAFRSWMLRTVTEYSPFPAASAPGNTSLSLSSPAASTMR